MSEDNPYRDAASGRSGTRKRVKKKVRIRVKLDSGRKQKKRRQNIVMALIIAFIAALALAAFVLYKMDQSSTPPAIEVMPPSGV